MISNRASLAAMSAFALGACATPDREREVVLNVRESTAENCRVLVEGRDFGLPAEQERLSRWLRSLARSGRAAKVDGDVDTPWRCVGFAIFAAQRAGFRGVGFIAEPPPIAPAQ